MADMAQNDRGAVLVAVDAVLMCLAISAVGLRLLSRRLAGAKFWWDDWFILLALPFILGLDISSFIAVHFGFGKDVTELSPDAATAYLKITYFDELAWCLSLGLIKYSILFFYRRIFPSPVLKIVLLVIGGCILAWQMGVLIAFIFQCIPVGKLWNQNLEGHCSDPQQLFWGPSIPNSVTDFVLVMLPIPLVWGLQLSRSQKIGLTATFLTGGFVCAISVVRITVITSVAPRDITYSYLPAIWSLVELNIGVLSACLPSMRILLKYLTNLPSPSDTSLEYRSSSSSSRRRRMGLGLGPAKPKGLPGSGGRSVERASHHHIRGYRTRSHSETGSLGRLASGARYEAHIRERQELERYGSQEPDAEIDTFNTFNSLSKDDPEVGIAVCLPMSRVSTDGLRPAAHALDKELEDNHRGRFPSSLNLNGHDNDRCLSAPGVPPMGTSLAPMTQPVPTVPADIPLNTIWVTREVVWRREERVLPVCMGASGLGRESPMLARRVEGE